MTQQSMATATAQSIADGYYTVLIGKEYRTFRIHTQDQDASFAPGQQVIATLPGPSNESNYTGFGFITDGKVIPWKRYRVGYETILAEARFLLRGDQEQAGRRYAARTGRCRKCNRILTSPESIAAGIGPICAGRRKSQPGES